MFFVSLSTLHTFYCYISFFNNLKTWLHIIFVGILETFIAVDMYFESRLIFFHKTALFVGQQFCILQSSVITIGNSSTNNIASNLKKRRKFLFLSIYALISEIIMYVTHHRKKWIITIVNYININKGLIIQKETWIIGICFTSKFFCLLPQMGVINISNFTHIYPSVQG